MAESAAVAKRRSFFDELARRRWQARCWGAFEVGLGLLLATPVVILLSPLSFLVLAGGARLLSLLGVAPQWALETLRLAGRLPFELIVMGARSELVLPMVLLLGPGYLFLAALAVAFRRRFRDDGVAAVLDRLGAREPEPDHEGERRLVALAEELAVAAQTAPPRVALLDLEVPQAAVVGSSPEDSVLLFTRGLVETLDRSETQAIAGHALAVAINGNAGLGATSLGLYQALYTVLLVLNPARWGELAHVVRWVAPGGKAGDAEDAARLLDESLFQARAGGVLATVRMAAIFVSYFFFRPVVGAVLQTRRLHADADTVRLTRDPTALARALKKLDASGAAPPGGVHLRHLWVVGGPYRLADEAGGGEPEEDGSVRIGRAPAHDPHPSVPRRLRHLAALGAELGGRVPTADPSALEGLRHALATESPFQIAFAALVVVLIAAVIVLPTTMLFVTACGVSTLVAGLLLWAISALLL